MLQLSTPEKPFGILLKIKPVRPNFMFCGNRKLGIWCLLGSTIKKRMVTTFKVKV
jgi:hypothetical protein